MSTAKTGALRTSSLPRPSSARMGLLGYWYAHLALIAEIILIAAGILIERRLDPGKA